MRATFSSAFAGLCLMAGGLPATAAGLLDTTFPRGKQVCYSATARAGTTRAISMFRLTRPLRYQSYDTRETRVVRVVINFAGPDRSRIEDSLTCRETGGRITCQSTTCDGTGFELGTGRQGELTVQQDKASPNVIWSCEQDAVRDLVLADEELSLVLRRGSGSCLD